MTMIARLAVSGLLIALVCLLSLGAFLALLWLHLFDVIPILFYRGIVISFVVGLVVLLAVLAMSGRFARQTSPFVRSFAAVSAAASAFCFLMFFHLMIPVSLDRSISVFMLASIGDAPQGLSKAEIEKVFVDTYVTRYDAFGRRVSEQAETGNIVLQDGRYRLTEQGRRFIAFSRSLTMAMGIDPRFVFPNGKAP